MTLPVLILRPLAGAQKTAASAEEIGLSYVVDPLFEIRPLNWSAPSPEQYDAIMLTSVNAMKEAGPDLSKYFQLPVLAVGEVTARAAGEAGFQVTKTGKGGVQSLADMLVDNSFSRILRLTGRDYSPVQSERNIETIAVYESAEIGLGPEAKRSLSSGCIILIHSKKAATVLATEIEKAEISRTDNHIVAISVAVATAAGMGWKSISVADEPNDDALLSAAARLCSGQTILRSPNEPGL